MREADRCRSNPSQHPLGLGCREHQYRRISPHRGDGKHKHSREPTGDRRVWRSSASKERLGRRAALNEGSQTVLSRSGSFQLVIRIPIVKDPDPSQAPTRKPPLTLTMKRQFICGFLTCVAEGQGRPIAEGDCSDNQDCPIWERHRSIEDDKRCCSAEEWPFLEALCRGVDGFV